MRIWLVVILGAILSGISYAAYEIELRSAESERIATLPLATSNKDTSAQSRESILGKAEETAEIVEPGVSNETADAPADGSDEHVAALERPTAPVEPPAAETAEVKPTFDVVSVDPDGTAVVAGRAAPGASVTLQIGDKAIGSARASDRGEWVIVPDEVIPGGAQSLSLEATPQRGGEPVKSDQVATIVLPDSASDTAPSEMAELAPRTSSAEAPAEQTASSPGTATAVDIPKPAESAPAGIQADAEPTPADVPVAEPELAERPDAPQAIAEIPPAATEAGAIPAPAEQPLDAGDEVARSAAIPAPSETLPAPAIVAEAAPATVAAPQSNPELAVREVTTPAAEDVVKVVPEIPEAANLAEAVPAASAPTVSEEPGSPTPEAEGAQQLASLPRGAAPAASTPASPPTEDRVEDTSEPEPIPAARALADEPAPAPESSGDQQEQSASAAADETKSDDAPESSQVASAPSSPSVPAASEAATSSPVEDSTPRASGAMVVLSQPGEPSRVLQGRTEPQAAPPPITFDSVDYDDGGRVIVAGQVEPGADVRAYIDNEILGDAQADEEGRWTLRATRHIEPGAYELRVDRIDQEGLVIARASAPFRPVAPDIVKRARERGEVVIQPGDNLWSIARDIYGQGTLYTVIYNANTNQIIDPDLIYPGQLLMTPGSSGLDRERAAAGKSG